MLEHNISCRGFMWISWVSQPSSQCGVGDHGICFLLSTDHNALPLPTHLSIYLSHNMQRCQRLLQFRPPLTRCNTTQAKSQSLLQPVAADMIGTPDPVTNLRPVRYYVPPDETQEVHHQRILVVKVLSFWLYGLGERVAITTRTSGRIQPKLLEEEQYHVYWSKSRIWREM